MPEIDGIDTFGGETYHTAIWPHEGVDLRGRRVAVIGTGSSGIQAIPLIAEQAAELTVFQRTPAYSTPAHNAPLDPDFVAARKASYQAYREQARTTRIGVVFDIADDSATAADPAERERRFRQGWDEGTLFGVASKFSDILIDPQANELASEFLRRQIRDIVVDPDVAERLSPRTFPYATKRPCLDTGYYETFNRPNVTLVDVRATPITEVDAGGIRTTERAFDVDVIVFATGFDAITGPLLAVNPIGLGGLTMREKWSAGPRTYLGLAIAGFPNLFLITGPGSPSVLTQRVRVDRTPRRLDHRSAGRHGRAWRDTSRGGRDGRGRLGRPCQRGRQLDAVSREQTPGTRAPTWPASHGCSCPTSAASACTASICAGVAADGYKGFALT